MANYGAYLRDGVADFRVGIGKVGFKGLNLTLELRTGNAFLRIKMRNVFMCVDTTETKEQFKGRTEVFHCYFTMTSAYHRTLRCSLRVMCFLSKR